MAKLCCRCRRCALNSVVFFVIGGEMEKCQHRALASANKWCACGPDVTATRDTQSMRAQRFLEPAASEQNFDESP